MTLTLEAPPGVEHVPRITFSRDARVSTLARWALDNSPYRFVSRLDCRVDGGVITLSGVVPSYYLKQLAQELLLRLDSGLRIDNRVEVALLTQKTYVAISRDARRPTRELEFIEDRLPQSLQDFHRGPDHWAAVREGWA
jgi:hypothetical protein